MYIEGRAEFEKAKMENDWKVMRWQSALIVNLMGSKKVTPEQLFTLGDETQTPRIDPNSPEAKAVFDRMEAAYLRKLQQKQTNG